jgi:hypothetical protein
LRRNCRSFLQAEEAMRRSSSLLLLALMLSAAPARSHGAVIGIDSLKQLADGRSTLPGVHVYDTGPDGAFQPIVGNWEVIGSANPIILNGVSRPFLDATIKFDQPLQSVGIDVVSTGVSILGKNVTFEAFSHSKRIAWETVRLESMGEVTHIELSAADIDKVEWSGSGEVFNPYFVKDFRYTYASLLTSSPPPQFQGPLPAPAAVPDVSAAVPPSDPLPQVGTVAPEPSYAALAMAVFAGFLVRRARPASSAQ